MGGLTVRGPTVLSLKRFSLAEPTLLLPEPGL
jgi:hypothetical protein